MLADHAGAAHFLHAAVAVGDDPVARQQLSGQLAVIDDGHGVGERVAALLRLRLRGQVAGGDADVDLITRVGHANDPLCVIAV